MAVKMLKAKLRSWLIELVREAIRSERVQPGNTYTLVAGPTLIPDNPVRPSLKAAPIVIAPSFEQLQAEAIAAQEKFYEPERA